MRLHYYDTSKHHQQNYEHYCAATMILHGLVKYIKFARCHKFITCNTLTTEHVMSLDTQLTFLNLCTPAPYKYLKKWIVLASDRRPESKSAKNLYGQIAARAVAKAPKFCHVTPTLKSLHWLKIYERIEYNLLSLTYKVLTTTQPGYLHNLTSAKSPRCTRSSSVVTLTHIFFIKITNRSFHYALPSLE